MCPPHCLSLFKEVRYIVNTHAYLLHMQTRYLLSEEAAAAAQVQTQGAAKKEVKTPQQVMSRQLHCDCDGL